MSYNLAELLSSCFTDPNQDARDKLRERYWELQRTIRQLTEEHTQELDRIDLQLMLSGQEGLDGVLSRWGRAMTFVLQHKMSQLFYDHVPHLPRFVPSYAPISGAVGTVSFAMAPGLGPNTVMVSCYVAQVRQEKEHALFKYMYSRSLPDFTHETDACFAVLQALGEEVLTLAESAFVASPLGRRGAP